MFLRGPGWCQNPLLVHTRGMSSSKDLTPGHGAKSVRDVVNAQSQSIGSPHVCSDSQENFQNSILTAGSQRAHSFRLTKRWFFPYLCGIQETGSGRPLEPSYADPANSSLWTVSPIFFQKLHCSDVSVPCGPSSSLFLGISLAQCKRFCWGIEVAAVQHHRGTDCQALLLTPWLWVLPMLRTIPSPKGMSIVWFVWPGLGSELQRAWKT